MSKEQDEKHFTDFRQLERERERARAKHKCNMCPYARWLGDNTLVFCSRFPCIKERVKDV
jgi:hypothetical protein